MANKLTIVQGKTFSDTLRWQKKPFVFKPITGISFASGAPRLTVLGHGVAEQWPVAITRVVGPKQINAKNTPPAQSDYVDATFVNASTIELNSVTPVNDNGVEWPAYESGGFIQYLTPVDLDGMEFRLAFRRSFSDRLNLKCMTGGVSGTTKPTAAGTDGAVVWVETADAATKPWAAGATFTIGDVIDVKAVLWLSSSSGGIVADNANKKIIATISPSVTATLAKQNLVYEYEAQDAGGVVWQVDSGNAVVELEGTP